MFNSAVERQRGRATNCPISSWQKVVKNGRGILFAARENKGAKRARIYLPLVIFKLVLCTRQRDQQQSKQQVWWLCCDR